ncbi:hypothetical protein SAMN05421747_108152 [Parapedobacter composti]|uniref:Uncharacterized protein n=1 Tax=Parapedobacter composti TaxID=623281 RepID=A0A1I1IHR8_9SPHI|nr:hypothetical protein SAMN05421747_108152 [Parapedobacter composti]
MRRRDRGSIYRPGFFLVSVEIGMFGWWNSLNSIY